MSEVTQGRWEKLILGGEELKQLEAATHLQTPPARVGESWRTTAFVLEFFGQHVF